MLDMEDHVLSELDVTRGIQTVSAGGIDNAPAGAATRGRREAREDHAADRGDEKSCHDEALHPIGTESSWAGPTHFIEEREL